MGRSSVITGFLLGTDGGRAFLVGTWMCNIEKSQHDCTEEGEGIEKQAASGKQKAGA